jgi:hypothetical protein
MENRIMIKFNERESWLAAAAVMLQHEIFPLAGIDPVSWEQRKYRVACGFPIGYRGSRTGKVTLGQAFDQRRWHFRGFHQPDP